MPKEPAARRGELIRRRDELIQKFVKKATLLFDEWDREVDLVVGQPTPERYRRLCDLADLIENVCRNAGVAWSFDPLSDFFLCTAGRAAGDHDAHGPGYHGELARRVRRLGHVARTLIYFAELDGKLLKRETPNRVEPPGGEIPTSLRDLNFAFYGSKTSDSKLPGRLIEEGYLASVRPKRNPKKPNGRPSGLWVTLGPKATSDHALRLGIARKRNRGGGKNRPNL